MRVPFRFSSEDYSGRNPGGNGGRESEVGRNEGIRGVAQAGAGRYNGGMAREKKMNLLVVTQKVNAEDAILGFFVQWIEGLARRVNRVFVLALETGPHELPDNVEVISLGKDRAPPR